MGTDCHVVVRVRASGVDARSLADLAERRVRELETLWSRFVPTSDTSRLNAAAGDPVEVDPATVELLRRADAARTATHGWFDPFLGRALVELGYDRTFEDVADPDRGAGPDEPSTNGPSQLERPAIGEPLRTPSPLGLDDAARTASLRGGVAFDPGGIGKGCAADLVVDGLPEHLAATGVLVNVGGDLRVWGVTPAGGWEVEVDHLVGPPVRVSLTHGALATSSTRRRRWPLSDGGEAHHVVDPSTCRPVTGPVASVSVLAGEAWWAEAVATAVLVGWGIDGPDPVLVDLSGDLGVLVTTNDGEQFVLGGRGSEFMVVAPEADGTLVESNVLEGSCREVVG